MDKIYEKEYEYLVKYYESSSGDPSALKSSEFASMVVNHDKILHLNEVEGIRIEAKHIDDGIEATIVVEEGVTLKNPVHLCFGMLPREGRQVIRSKIVAKEGSRVHFLSHCIFPNVNRIEHIMESEIFVGDGASVTYDEIHIHGKTGEIIVKPKSSVFVSQNGEYSSSIVLKTGRAGKISIDVRVDLSEFARATLLSKIYGRYDDEIVAKESIILRGAGSKGLIKTRMVLRDESSSKVLGEVIGLGEDSRGHVDCTEIIMDSAEARASPVVVAKHPKSKVTHEAAIGSIDKKQLITLMARGLSEEEAIDVIVGGLLR